MYQVFNRYIAYLIQTVFVAGTIMGCSLNDSKEISASIPTIQAEALMNDEPLLTSEITRTPIQTKTPTPTRDLPSKTPTPLPEPTRNLKTPPARPAIRDIWIRAYDNMKMIYVGGGPFEMGARDNMAESDEFPRHQVRLKSFWIDQTEITNGQYRKCINHGACTPLSPQISDGFRGNNQPATGVSWFDANTYCSWVEARLPTEAEWEYVALGRSDYIFPWGNEHDYLCKHAKTLSCNATLGGYTSPVGSFPRGTSWIGAHDMAGNVSEWVNDWYQFDYYESSPLHDPQGPPSGEHKVYRGGSYGSDMWWTYRSTNRISKSPESASIGIGFRCARDDQVG